ncbi:MAG: EamA family transporter RarD [Candidatus Adiutrix sp.]|nr:EamA family transporter RarD [Candidatus Adiutrix sp.]
MKNCLNPGALALAVGSSAMWGLLPAYWKLFSDVPAYEVLAHRAFWSFIFMAFMVTMTGRGAALRQEVRVLAARRRKIVFLVAGAIIVCFNWLTYIWAVNHDRVVESSLGYYISPLLNVLTGVILLRERLSLWQFLAVLLAAAGVLHLTVNYGSLPLVSLFLAGSITVYHLCKKITGLSAISGMTLETALIAPAALIFIAYLQISGQGRPIAWSPSFLPLAGTGAVTAIPMIMFAYSINRLPLTIIGLSTYVSPTIMLLLGVFVYRETFTRAHFIAFGLIWGGLLLFSLAKSPPLAALERRLGRAWGRNR